MRTIKDMSTTNLKSLRSGLAFTWGTVLKWYEAGPYTIAEFERNGDSLKTEFHVWVNGEDTRHSSLTLDEALALAIAYRHEGPNTRAAGYFMRMLDIQE